MEREQIINILVERNGLLDENIATNDPTHAEQIFCEKCKENFNEWNALTQEDLDDILADGYYDNRNGVCVMISHADYRGTK